MQKLTFLLLLAIAVCPARAQVMVNIQLPATGITLKSQLWNLSLINTGLAEKDVQIQLALTDASSNQRVLTGLTKLFHLPKGMRQVLASDIMPVAYTINNPGYRIDASADGFLPVGSFLACYTVIERSSDAGTVLGDDCERVDVEPLSPPALVQPADSEQVELSRPAFNWLPPTPAQFFNNLLYEWVLVEVEPSQRGTDAIQKNIPLLTRPVVAATSFQYPLSYPALSEGKLYAWQVSAKNGNSLIAKSEVWTFRIKPPTPPGNKDPAGFYVRLKKEQEAGFVVCNGTLSYEYVNELNDTLLSTRLFDLSTAAGKPIGMDASLPVKFGQNFMQLPVDNIPGITDRHIYLFEATNSKNEKWYVKFEYRKP